MNNNNISMVNNQSKEVERQKTLDSIGKIMGFETTDAKSIRILNKIFEDLDKDLEKEGDC